MNSLKKYFIASLVFAACCVAPAFAKGSTLLTLQPHFTMPLGKDKHEIQYGFGGGG